MYENKFSVIAYDREWLFDNSRDAAKFFSFMFVMEKYVDEVEKARGDKL